MSKAKTTEELLKHSAQSLEILKNYILSLISSDDESDHGKADKLCYWISDWAGFLQCERGFSPRSLTTYKRGQIIKVHLGFNIGSEEGGLHYGIVLEKDNTRSSPVVTIVPLTSVKKDTSITNLRPGNIYIGDELFAKLNAKASGLQSQINSELRYLNQFTSTLPEDGIDDTELNIITGLSFMLKAKREKLDKIKKEILKMKSGSIALLNQITTISKLRIYDPKNDEDVFANIRLSGTLLDVIDEALVRKYTNINI